MKIIAIGFNEMQRRAASESANCLALKLNSSDKTYSVSVLHLDELSNIEEHHKQKDVQKIIIAYASINKREAEDINKELVSKGYDVQLNSLGIKFNTKAYHSIEDVLVMNGKKASKTFGIDSVLYDTLFQYLSYHYAFEYPKQQKAFHWIYKKLEAENMIKYNGFSKELRQMASNAKQVERLLSYYTGVTIDDTSSTWNGDIEDRAMYESIIIKG